MRFTSLTFTIASATALIVICQAQDSLAIVNNEPVIQGQVQSIDSRNVLDNEKNDLPFRELQVNEENIKRNLLEDKNNNEDQKNQDIVLLESRADIQPSDDNAMNHFQEKRSFLSDVINTVQNVTEGLIKATEDELTELVDAVEEEFGVKPNATGHKRSI